MSMVERKVDGTKLQIGQFVDFIEVEKPLDIAPTEDCRWLVLLTEPNREFTVTANLTLRRVPLYEPTYTKIGGLPTKAHLARKTHPDIVRPIFPGILFVREDVVAAKRDLIRTAYGVLGNDPFMRFGPLPRDVAVVRPDAMRIIQGIELLEREKYLAERDRRVHPRFAVGEEVRTAVGQLLGGYNGTIEHIDDQGRITLLMAIMKREVRVHLTQDKIDKL